MPISSIPHTPLASGQVNQQRAEATPEKSEQRRASLSSENSSAGTAFNDNVTLSKSDGTQGVEKTAGLDAPASKLDTASATALLQQTSKTILTESKTALSAQSNLTPQTAQGFLAEA